MMRVLSKAIGIRHTHTHTHTRTHTSSCHDDAYFGQFFLDRYLDLGGWGEKSDGAAFATDEVAA